MSSSWIQLYDSQDLYDLCTLSMHVESCAGQCDCCGDSPRDRLPSPPAVLPISSAPVETGDTTTASAKAASVTTFSAAAKKCGMSRPRACCRSTLATPLAKYGSVTSRVWCLNGRKPQACGAWHCPSSDLVRSFGVLLPTRSDLSRQPCTLNSSERSALRGVAKNMQ